MWGPRIWILHSIKTHLGNFQNSYSISVNSYLNLRIPCQCRNTSWLANQSCQSSCKMISGVWLEISLCSWLCWWWHSPDPHSGWPAGSWPSFSRLAGFQRQHPPTSPPEIKWTRSQPISSSSWVPSCSDGCLHTTQPPTLTSLSCLLPSFYLCIPAMLGNPCPDSNLRLPRKQIYLTSEFTTQCKVVRHAMPPQII